MTTIGKMTSLALLAVLSGVSNDALEAQIRSDPYAAALRRAGIGTNNEE